MNYSDDDCMARFTLEQVRRMRCSIETYRPEIAKNSCLAPSITQQPLGQSVCEGAEVILSVATSSMDDSYQWRLNGVDLPGETSATLRLESVSQDDSGDSFTVRVSNSCGDVLSDAAIVMVQDDQATLSTWSNSFDIRMLVSFYNTCFGP